MAREPLDLVLRLRRRTVDDARRGLASAMAAASAAEIVARDAEHCIEAEAQRASDPEGGDSMVDAFARWLPGARFRAAEARAAQERQQAEVSRWRAELAAARTGLETIEALLAERRQRAASEDARRTQQALDEVGRGNGRPPA